MGKLDIEAARAVCKSVTGGVWELRKFSVLLPQALDELEQARKERDEARRRCAQEVSRWADLFDESDPRYKAVKDAAESL